MRNYIMMPAEYLKKCWTTLTAVILMMTMMPIGGEAMPTAPSIALNDISAVRAILGEASGEGYRGMLAVACAIRNRKTLKGVYGVHAKHVDQQSKKVWQQAKQAWKESQHNDITKGASGWGNKEDLKKFKKEKWWKNATVTTQIGNHYFYKTK